MAISLTSFENFNLHYNISLKSILVCHKIEKYSIKYRFLFVAVQAVHNENGPAATAKFLAAT